MDWVQVKPKHAPNLPTWRESNSTQFNLLPAKSIEPKPLGIHALTDISNMLKIWVDDIGYH